MMRKLLRLLSFLRPHRRLLAGLVGLGLFISAANIAQAFIFADILTRIFSARKWTSVLPLIFGALVLMIFRALAHGGAEWLGAVLGGRIKGGMREALCRKLLALGPNWTVRTHTGLVQTTALDSVEMVERFFKILVPRGIVSLLTLIPLLSVVVALDGVVGAAVLGATVVALIAPVACGHAIRKHSRFWWESYLPLHAGYLESIQGMTTLKALNAARHYGSDLLVHARAVRDRAIRVIRIEAVSGGVITAAVSLGTALSVGLGAFRLASGELSREALLLILLLVSQCFVPVRMLQQAFHSVYYFPIMAAKIFAMLDTVPQVAEADAPRSLTSVEPRVEFRNVTFRYRQDGDPVLKNLSLEVRPGETVGLVGRSGEGKSTIVSLLLRFFDPGEGQVLLGGYDLRELGLEFLRRQIAIVSQDTWLIHGTIRANLLLARPAASREEIEAAMRAAAMHDFVNTLPEGYETVVGERGLKLSGGERQRIAIARALLKNAPILVLDEATASLDVANEEAIQEALQTAMRGRTTVIIAHRLSTVRNADRILVLHGGRIVETGTHESLSGTGGIYARMSALQGGAR